MTTYCNNGKEMLLVSMRKKLLAQECMVLFQRPGILYYEKGIVLRFVDGYSKEKVVHERILHERALNKAWRMKGQNLLPLREKVQVPLRPLDTNDYALVLYFDTTLKDYSLLWGKVLSLSPYTPKKYAKYTKRGVEVSVDEFEQSMQSASEALQKYQSLTEVMRQVKTKKSVPMITGGISRKKKYEPAHDKALISELSLTQDSWLERLLPVKKTNDSYEVSSAVRRNLSRASSSSKTSWLEKLLPPKKRNSPKDPPDSEPVIQTPPKKPKDSPRTGPVVSVVAK